MKIDFLTEMCSDQALGATAAVVGDVIDNRNADGTVRQIGAGEDVYVVVSAMESMKGSTSLQTLTVVTADDAALTTNPVVIAASEALSNGEFDLTGLTTTGAGSIVRASGSFVTDGWQVGDIVRITASSSSQASNLNRDMVVASVAALTLGVTGFLADTATTATIFRRGKACFMAGKRLINSALPGNGLKAYIGIKQSIATSLTKGKIDAFFANDVPQGKVAAKSNVFY